MTILTTSDLPGAPQANDDQLAAALLLRSTNGFITTGVVTTIATHA